MRFFETKSIERTLDYGARQSNYYWINIPIAQMEYRETLKVTSYCHFDFSNYPFDSHNCSFLVGSDILATYNLILDKPSITFRFKNNFTQNDILNIEEQNVPYEISAQSIDPYEIDDNGYNYRDLCIKNQKNDSSCYKYK